jgi:hypothetical protein
LSGVCQNATETDHYGRKELAGETMRAFENIEIAFVDRPTEKLVLERIRRDETCGASPLSACCVLARGKVVKYLVEDVADPQVCRHCPVFDQKLQTLISDWEDWVLRRQDVFS